MHEEDKTTNILCGLSQPHMVSLFTPGVPARRIRPVGEVLDSTENSRNRKAVNNVARPGTVVCNEKSRIVLTHLLAFRSDGP